MSRPSSPGYLVGSSPYGDRHQPSVTFLCAHCEEPNITRFPGGRVSVEHAAKRARRAGWVIEPERPASNLCPRCIVARRERAAGEKPDPKPIRPTNQQEKVALSVTPIKPATPGQPREPTQQERLRIRQKLDGHFDDSAGCYLDGWSDQRIGEELNIPWAIVARIREAAYGPIRVDPELAAMRAELVGLGTKIEALLKAQHGLVERVMAFEKKRGVA